ncbi:MAG TPA: hypothetical protein VFP65_23115 [Anaeromyxobacteraceae bacterium]|nr:hypothetical protein [Anaeromyxobacteraceae bacterium]
MSATKHITPLLLALAALAGCGGIDSPDLGKGQVTGSLTGAKPGAFAYALGHPETKAAVENDGTFVLKGVPIDSTQVVVFDGQQKIDLVGVEVKPAKESSCGSRDSSALKYKASTILAAARPAGGVSTANTEYKVEGVALQDDARGAAATLFPIPPGKFKVRAVAKGLRDVPVDVDVSEDASYQVELDMDVDDNDHSGKGCVSNGCSGSLKCNGDSSGKGDGRCYACTDSSQCSGGLKCDNYTCVADGDGRSVCLPCTSASQCAPGRLGQPAACAAMPGDPTAVCTHGCTTSADCPSGLACGANGFCVATDSCNAVLQAFGPTCMDDSTCSTALADARCIGLVKGSHDVVITPGYCSSRCTVQDDCPAGYSCATDPTLGKTGTACVKNP